LGHIHAGLEEARGYRKEDHAPDGAKDTLHGIYLVD